MHCLVNCFYDKSTISEGDILGSEEKLVACKNLGADVVINYKTEDFVAGVKEETGGKGVDVILDHLGASYLQRNLDSLNVDGRLFLISIMGGAVGEVNLNSLLTRRLTYKNTAARLRFRSAEKKAEIIREVEKNVWPAIASGKVKPVVYKYFPLYEASEDIAPGINLIKRLSLHGWIELFHAKTYSHVDDE